MQCYIIDTDMPADGEEQRCNENVDLLNDQYIDQYIELSQIPCLTCRLSDLMSEYHRYKKLDNS